MRINISGTVFFLAILFFLNTNNVSAIDFTWLSPDISNEGKDYTVFVGEASRMYKKSVHFKNGENCQWGGLPITEGINYIAAKVDGSDIYSKEIVLFWTNGEKDKDKDGLSNSLEEYLGTNPEKKDSDDDGILDGEEYAIWGRHRALLDYDEDGVINILDPDSDNDGILDGEDSDIQRISKLFISGGSWTITWDRNDDKRKLIYRVFMRMDNEPYDFEKWACEVVETDDNDEERMSCVIKDLEYGHIYYAVVKSLSPHIGNAESEISKEVHLKF